MLKIILITLFAVRALAEGSQEPLSQEELIQQVTQQVYEKIKSEKKPEAVPLIQFSGDFRYRHQAETKATSDERRIQRLQAKLGLLANIHDNLKFTLRMMTGKDAVSGNQTLGDPKNPPMARRDFGLDQAYFEYQAFPVWTIWGGKMAQPFAFAGKHQLILDRDITPEGIAMRLKGPVTEEVDLFLTGGSFWVRENYDDSVIGQGIDQTDSFLNGVQTGAIGKIGSDWLLTVEAGIYSYTAMKDQPITNYGIATADKARGNTLYVNNNVNYYPTNFDIQESSAELKYKQTDWDLGLYYVKVKNIDPDTLNEAKSYGFFGTYKNFGFSWMQQEVQKDSVFSLMTDSDFGGGETSSKGQVISLSYKITKKVQLAYTTFTNQTSIETSVPLDYKRSHLDLSMSF